MKLPDAPARYDAAQENIRNRLLEKADGENLKERRDVRISNPARFILQSPNGAYWSISVSNAGALVVTSVP